MKGAREGEGILAGGREGKGGERKEGKTGRGWKRKDEGCGERGRVGRKEGEKEGKGGEMREGVVTVGGNGRRWLVV